MPETTHTFVVKLTGWEASVSISENDHFGIMPVDKLLLEI